MGHAVAHQALPAAVPAATARRRDVAFLVLAGTLALGVIGLAVDLLIHPQGTGLVGQGLWLRVWLGLIVSPIVLAIGTLIVWRLPGNTCGRLLMLVAVASVGVQIDPGRSASLPRLLATEALIVLATGLIAPSLGYLMLTFPTGHVYPAAWARPALVAAGIKVLGALLELLATPVPVRIFRLPANPLFISALAPYRAVIAATIGITGILWPMIIVAGLASVVLRYRHASVLDRQQIKWVMWGFGLFVPGAMAAFGAMFRYGPDSPQFLVAAAIAATTQIVFLSSIGAAILRYRLFSIDLLISRTLVYGSLTVIIVGVYVILVGGLSEVFQSRGSLVLSLVATGLVAVLFQPLRDRLQRDVNRLLYGERDDPYAVLSRLGRRLEATLAPEAVLPAVVETLAQALKLPYVAVALYTHGAEVPEIAAAHGQPTAAPARWPLAYQSERIGELLAAPRGPGETFTPAEQRLLNDVAHQAGVAAHAVRLTADLQRSRERLVAAREEERRRLRRDLHDGLGPALASQTLTLTAARQLLRDHPDQAEALLAEAIRHAQGAVNDIRRVVYELRPPALDDLGLAGALRALAGEYGASGLRFEVSVPEPLPPLPAAVEVACYRIAQEALTNVVRHAQAARCALTVTLGEALTLEVADDGRGLPPGRRAGVGLASMRERTDELGGACRVEPGSAGGTRVVATLPLG